MSLLLILLSGVLVVEAELDFGFVQNDYELKFQRIELVRQNKEFLKTFIVVTRKYNRTQPVTNATFAFKRDMGSDITFVLQLYKFLSNEYRDFPMRFGGNLCKAISSNMFGLKRIFDCGNLTACPSVKDRVNHVCNFYPDPHRFPPLIPNGDYKAEVQLNYFSEEVAVVHVYVVVSRQIPVKENASRKTK